jgi:hypothetical protein
VPQPELMGRIAAADGSGTSLLQLVTSERLHRV